MAATAATTYGSGSSWCPSARRPDSTADDASAEFHGGSRRTEPNESTRGARPDVPADVSTRAWWPDATSKAAKQPEYATAGPTTHGLQPAKHANGTSARAT